MTATNKRCISAGILYHKNKVIYSYYSVSRKGRVEYMKVKGRDNFLGRSPISSLSVSKRRHGIGGYMGSIYYRRKSGVHQRRLAWRAAKGGRGFNIRFNIQAWSICLSLWCPGMSERKGWMQDIKDAYGDASYHLNFFTNIIAYLLSPLCEKFFGFPKTNVYRRKTNVSKRKNKIAKRKTKNVPTFRTFLREVAQHLCGFRAGEISPKPISNKLRK